MKIKVHKLNSFVINGKGGNPAGVALEGGEKLSESQMQDIAAKLNYSETVFLLPSAKADYRARYFTPVSEIDLCGHATIALCYAMNQLAGVKTGEYSLETKAGVIKIFLSNGKTMFMSQNPPIFSEVLKAEEVAGSLGISVKPIEETGLPIQIVSTGLRDIVVPMPDLETLKSLKLNFEEIAAVSARHSCGGYHLFTQEVVEASDDFCCRNVAPAYGIPEESATGTSNGVLSCYAFRHGLLNAKKAQDIRVEQGFFMGNPSRIFAKLGVKGKEIKEVRVGGEAVVFGEKYFEF